MNAPRRAGAAVTCLALLLAGAAEAGPYGKQPAPPRPPSDPGKLRVPHHHPQPGHPVPKGLERRLNMKLGEPPSEKPAPLEDPEARRIEANRRLHEIDEALKKKRAEQRRVWDLMDYVDMYPEKKAKVAYEDLDMIDADQVDDYLGDWYDGLKEEIERLEKERKQVKAKLDAALTELEKERKAATRVDRLPRDARGRPVIDGELGGDEPFDPSAKGPPGGTKTGAKAATSANASGGQPTSPKSGTSGTGKAPKGTGTGEGAAEPKSPAQEALDLLDQIEADGTRKGASPR